MINHLKNSLLRLVPATCLLLLIYAYFLRCYLGYFPYGDDPAILHGSAGSPKSWFTEGFSKYFVVYPEWTVPFTDFVRPGVNLIIRLSQLIFGSHFAFYFASYYVAQLTLCAVVIALASHFGVASKWLWVVGLIAAINPAFVGYGLVRISHQFDVWCGVFTLLAFLLILRRSYGFALVALTLAVFTKEPALYAPIAACLTVCLQPHARKRLAAWMLVPLALWVLVRTTIFHGSFSGIYVVQRGPKPAILLTIAKGLLMWPLGLGTYSSHLKDILTTPKTAVIVAGNQILWLFLAILLVQTAKTGLKNDFSRNCLTLLVWLGGALSFGVFAGHDPRFGGSIYPLEIVLSAVVLSRAPNRYNNRVAQFALAGFAFAFAWNTRQILLSLPLHQSDGMSQLVSAIRANASGSKTIYVLNSVEAYSAPQSIESLACTTSNLIILNEFDGCAQSSEGSINMLPAGNALEIRSVLPKCAHYVFDGVPNSIMVRAFTGSPNRGDYASYDFPARYALKRDPSDGRSPSLDLGRELDIRLIPPADGQYILLYYEWAAERFRCLGKTCAIAYL